MGSNYTIHMKGDRILEPEGIQHIPYTPEAMEDNNPARIRNLESLVNNYS